MKITVTSIFLDFAVVVKVVNLFNTFLKFILIPTSNYCCFFIVIVVCI